MASYSIQRANILWRSQVRHNQMSPLIYSDLVSNAVNVATAIDKVRNIARIIRNSPVKNDILQSYVES